MQKKVLIANRGAIAVRITKTLRKLNIQSICIYAEQDRESLHVRMADQAFSLGDGPAKETYLNQDKILSIAKRLNVDAVHPGYGFLSENPDFVVACEEAGIKFIGPNAEQIKLFGLKHTAREVAHNTNTALLPGSDLLESIDEAINLAQNIQYPVILKSTAGGGGIGMRVCNDETELRSAFESVKRLSKNNFSNDGIYIEKYISKARHIEAQVIGDGKGHVVCLGLRDCSTQRRHQKVIEETPAPDIPDKVASSMLATAKRLMEHVNYLNAGTVEFIYDGDAHEYYFLEVNTRLQVEHGVTEEIYRVDLVECMVKLALNENYTLSALENLVPSNHSIQVRIYAEDPNKQFLPSAGLLTHVSFPPEDAGTRVETWVRTGTEVSSFFDPMLAKLIVTAKDRSSAIEKLKVALENTRLEGIETNVEYVIAIINNREFYEGKIFTRYLDSFLFIPKTVDVLSPGTLTTIQDYPGRLGYWDVGVPPSGPFDSLSFRLGNRLLGNPDGEPGLEITLHGPKLKFNCETYILIAGPEMDITLDAKPISSWEPIRIERGQVLNIGKIKQEGARAYLLFRRGLNVQNYLGSSSTFALGKFGGLFGRSLKTGDVLKLQDGNSDIRENTNADCVSSILPEYKNNWDIRVIYGPHGAPDFFTPSYIQTFFKATWEVHYNSSRTGVRLIGPKPEWARSDGGEAGLHPSNIHDNAYAVGCIDFTGDMPVILGPDGPSLGGFVCPATVISADLWKLGQLKAGDKLNFIPVGINTARALELQNELNISDLKSVAEKDLEKLESFGSPVLRIIDNKSESESITIRIQGDRNILLEFGSHTLDIALRFRVHALMLSIESKKIQGVEELTPGIRSLQIKYDARKIEIDTLIDEVITIAREQENVENLAIPARVVHLPLSWNDEACQQAVEKYMQVVRKDAPWCPDNLEFIRRINGLSSIEKVKEIVFSAQYLVMGLGDVYLGAPVATPLDPRHRLVTTKYNPARTWTAENSVGIGGSYLCIYGMEGPGGYQFVGRTLHMWNRFNKTAEFSRPWLLRFFDHIQFFEVSESELRDIRNRFPNGEYPIKIEEINFRLADYKRMLAENRNGIEDFNRRRKKAFELELQQWVETGQLSFELESSFESKAPEVEIPDNCELINSPVSGSVWKINVQEGDTIQAQSPAIILESMKMEIEIPIEFPAKVVKILIEAGHSVQAGQALLVVKPILQA